MANTKRTGKIERLARVFSRVFCTTAQSYYLDTLRELKRVDAVTKSSIIAEFGEILSGVATIRALWFGTEHKEAVGDKQSIKGEEREEEELKLLRVEAARLRERVTNHAKVIREKERNIQILQDRLSAFQLEYSQ
ncbi:hypothetical protein PPACK8108_LOCUS5200 [Phakopsora pachyrhizi]|uniref:Uncharacterized protein n=1 Tax=Phakopsora pachyrhizi TaxID=170000 RepID=A0AAV0ARP8_PHAPC|nr:hypothetical protein PPACK8108_LOCUS5200 [Phakopsora pachyrhizi]